MGDNKTKSQGRADHMNLLLRKNQGKILSEKLANSILQKTNIREVNFSTLEQRDLLWENYCKLYKNEKARQIFKLEEQKEKSKLKRILKQLMTSNQQFRGCVFFNHFENVGTFQVSTSLFFENADVLLEMDGDSIFILDVDLKNGILLDYYESDSGSGWTYELIILGPKWSEAFYTLVNKIIKESKSLENSRVH